MQRRATSYVFVYTDCDDIPDIADITIARDGSATERISRRGSFRRRPCPRRLAAETLRDWRRIVRQRKGDARLVHVRPLI